MKNLKLIIKYSFDNGWFYVFFINLFLAIFLLLNFDWCTEKFAEAVNSSSFDGVLVGFAFSMPFVVITMLLLALWYEWKYGNIV